MQDITKIDKNFLVNSTIHKEDVHFYNAEEAPFRIYGIFKENGKFRRMPKAVAEAVSGGVHSLHTDTAGGRVRFKTDSPYIVIHAEMNVLRRMPHFSFSGSIGFDMYVDNVYTKTFIPPIDVENGYESIAEFETKTLREITINFPLYSGVNTLYVGLQAGATLTEASPYKNKKPIVFYGSSITQGGCASRPGMSYENILARRLGYDVLNLGFSGAARGEDAMAEYIKKLDMHAFVYDYDYNAPTWEHLAATHEKMFKTIREANPVLPIIMMSRPKLHLTDEEIRRRNIIETTYQNARASGDTNVYFIDGRALTALCGGEGTVDNCHPTDFGFASMAKAIEDVVVQNGI